MRFFARLQNDDVDFWNSLTDKFKSYDGLVMYGFKHERIDKNARFANGKVYINDIEGSWSYTRGGY
jgi:hypothetical protein